MALQNIIIVLIAVSILIITLLTYQFKKDAVRQSFLLLGIGFSLWIISLISLQSFQLTIFVIPIFFSAFLAFGGFYILVSTFPDTTISLSRKHYFYIAPLVSLSIFLPQNLIVKDVIFHTDGHIEPINGPLFPLFIAITLVYLVSGLQLIIKKWRNSTGKKRIQISYLTLGLGSTFTCIFFADILLPALGIYKFNLIGAASPIFFVALTSYAILRHQLLDIKVVIQRGLIYSILFVFILVLYASLLQLVHLILIGPVTTNFITAFLTTIIGIASIPHIDNYLRKKTDRIFFKDKYNYKDALYSLSEATNRKLVLKDIIEQTEETLKKLFKAESVTMTIIGQNEEIIPDDIEKDLYHNDFPTIPIRIEDKVIGLLTLRQKLSGDSYTNEDIGLLRTFSNQVAVAVEKARLYKRVNDNLVELEKRVEERTQDIKMLQESQNQMMLEIAHRLQNPLTFLKLECDFLSKQMPENKNISLFGKTIDESSQFVYDLLHLARLGTQSKDVNFKEINLSEILMELIEYYEVVTKNKHITLSYDIDTDILIIGSQDKVKELISNLVSNAIKYMSGETVLQKKEISVTLKKQSKNITLSVSDTGVGIDGEDLPHIFDKFYRVKETETNISGTGLGLAICKKIIELHGGTIDAVSTKGKGSVFTLTFNSIAV